MMPTVAYVLAKAHEEFKDKTYEMEFSIISRDTNFKHEIVHRDHRERL